MGTDFPAAHSMDTEWFAVDRDGQVAVFVSGENGSVPADAPPGDIDDVLGALGSAISFENSDDATVFPEVARLGLHVYEAGLSWFSPPYERTYRPERPLHVDQLPPTLRQQAKAVRFDDLRFADHDVLQPCDRAEGYAWAAGYVAEDGHTVRPVPGKEAEYRQEVEDMRREFPAEHERYHFEGLQEGD
jgi:hypothetical protein